MKKWWSSKIKYEHQINWANACDTNLDDCTSRSVRNARIVLLSTLTLHSPKRMANLEVCTLYNRKNRIILYDFLQIIRVHSLLLFVSSKSTYIIFGTLLYVLALFAIHGHHRRVCDLLFFYQALHRLKKFPLARRAKGKSARGSRVTVFWSGTTSYYCISVVLVIKITYFFLNRGLLNHTLSPNFGVSPFATTFLPDLSIPLSVFTLVQSPM